MYCISVWHLRLSRSRGHYRTETKRSTTYCFFFIFLFASKEKKTNTRNSTALQTKLPGSIQVFKFNFQNSTLHKKYRDFKLLFVLVIRRPYRLQRSTTSLEGISIKRLSNTNWKHWISQYISNVIEKPSKKKKKNSTFDLYWKPHGFYIKRPRPLQPPTHPSGHTVSLQIR